MPDNFEQISTKSGFMKHNGGLLVKKISENEFQFKAKITSNHLNRAGITHGGYIASIIDAGCGSAAHRSVENIPCVTIALDIKFIAPTKLNDEIIGTVTVEKKTNSFVFLSCKLKSKNKIISLSIGTWKILN